MMGRRGLRGRFSFWIGPVAVSFLDEPWLSRFYFGPAGCGRGGKTLILYGVRVQFGGPTPWKVAAR
jgi:hypothetical protein